MSQQIIRGVIDDDYHNTTIRFYQTFYLTLYILDWLYYKQIKTCVDVKAGRQLSSSGSRAERGLFLGDDVFLNFFLRRLFFYKNRLSAKRVYSSVIHQA